MKKPWKIMIQQYKNPEDSTYYFNKANTLAQMYRCEEALENYDSAIQKYPEDSRYFGSKAFTLDKMCRFEEALENYDLAIQRNPEDSKLFYSKAKTLVKIYRFEEALEIVFSNPQLTRSFLQSL